MFCGIMIELQRKEMYWVWARREEEILDQCFAIFI
jgi:hypothetical protein